MDMVCSPSRHTYHGKELGPGSRCLNRHRPHDGECHALTHVHIVAFQVTDLIEATNINSLTDGSHGCSACDVARFVGSRHVSGPRLDSRAPLRTIHLACTIIPVLPAMGRAPWSVFWNSGTRAGGAAGR